MPTYALTATARQQFFTDEGIPAVGYFLYTYAANSSTPRTTYVAQGGGANENPIELDARGEADIWLDPALFYKFVLKTNLDVTVWTVDYVSAANNGSVFDDITINGGTINGEPIDDIVFKNVAQTIVKAKRGLPGALTDASSITPDFAESNNFSVTLAGDRTLENPTNIVAGQSGIITITQDGSGNQTLAYGTYWKFAGGAAPTLSTAAGAVDSLVYYTVSTTFIQAKLLKAFA